MNWKAYIDRLAASRSNTEIAKLAGVTPGNITKWRNGSQGVDAAVAIRLAREVGDSPLAVLVQLGFLTADEAGFASPGDERPYWEPWTYTNDELLAMVRSRMIGKEGEGDADRPAPNTPPSPAGDDAGQQADVTPLFPRTPPETEWSDEVQAELDEQADAARRGDADQKPDTTTGQHNQDPGGMEPS